ncbi:hypothetical protein Tco_1329768 [Tanacetum coccineum]
MIRLPMRYLEKESLISAIFICLDVLVFNTRRQKVKETYHVTFNESMEAIRFTNTPEDEIGINDSFRYPSDEWSQDQQIEFVNIIGDPSEGLFTRSKASKLTAASPSECLFADFLFEIEPKKTNLVSPLPFSGKKKKVKSQTMTPTLPKSQGPEASESLPQKRKKLLSKKAPKETKATPTPKPTECSDQSHSVSSGTGTRISQPLPKDTTTHPKDSGGNVQPTDKGLPSTASNEGTTKTTSRPKGLLGDKDLGGNKSPTDMELINPIVADPSGTGAEYQVDET